MQGIKTWKPDSKQIKSTNIYKAMQDAGIDNYRDFWEWSVKYKEDFWTKTVAYLNIPLYKKYDQILDLSYGVEQAKWLAGAKMNIADACFPSDLDDPFYKKDKTAIIFQKENGQIKKMSYLALANLTNRIANSIVALGLQKGDIIAIDMPMTIEAVAIYLAGIKIGTPVATIADSFTPPEIKIRLEITKPKLVFTQDVQIRAGKELPLYEKVIKTGAPKTIIFRVGKKNKPLRPGDLYWNDFLIENNRLQSAICDPDDTTTILFSSGTTGAPKAIPWTHITPIKSASDGFYHHDIHESEVVAWPTNLGWMMGPWLVFAGFINKATIALYYGAPTAKNFGKFIQDARVNMFGLVPSIVKHWKSTGDMEEFDWSAIKCFSSTGEVSNPSDYTYLMSLANHKPIIEYCGGTEIGGGYVTSSLVQENIPSTFSTQALGGEFILLDENGQSANQGEVFIIPPVLGLSNRLLNKDHNKVYYEGIPKYNGLQLRRHGDEMLQLENGYYKATGRTDDAMNLGGIKVSSLQIEQVVNTLDFVTESAAIGIPPIEGGPDQLIIYYVHNKEINIKNALSDIKQIVKNEINPLFKVEDVMLVEKLPRTASGKVMRRVLRLKYQEKA